MHAAKGSVGREGEAAPASLVAFTHGAEGPFKLTTTLDFSMEPWQLHGHYLRVYTTRPICLVHSFSYSLCKASRGCPSCGGGGGGGEKVSLLLCAKGARVKEAPRECK